MGVNYWSVVDGGEGLASVSLMDLRWTFNGTQKGHCSSMGQQLR